MNILLIQHMGYLYKLGGAHKANRILMSKLAAEGHTCRVLTVATDVLHKPMAYVLDHLQREQITPREVQDGRVIFDHEGVEVWVIPSSLHLLACIPEQVKTFADVALVSEDRTYLLFEAALQTDASKTVYLSHSQSTLPFGPDSMFVNLSKKRLFQQAAGVITVTKFVQRYLQQWGEVESEVISFPSYAPPPYPHLANFEQGYVTMINPSLLKGMTIFLEIVQKMPQVQFAAVPTWGAEEKDLALLRQYPNLTLLTPSENIADIMKQTKLLLVPSLWGESFGQVVIDAMLHGVPVIASQVGGLPEAKLGVDYLIPVRPIEKYEDRPDEFSTLVPIIPKQNVTPWVETIGQLCDDQALYTRLSQQSQQAALQFVQGLGVGPFVRYFEGIIHQRGQHISPAGSRIQQLTQQLTPQQQLLLARRLRERQKAKTAG